MAEGGEAAATMKDVEEMKASLTSLVDKRMDEFRGVGPRGRLGSRRGSSGWVLGCTRGPAGGHRGRSSGAPGVMPAVTGVGRQGRPGSRRGSPVWVVWGARGPAGGYQGGSSGAPGVLPGSPGWVFGGARRPAGGHLGGSSGAPGVPPGVTGVGPWGLIFLDVSGRIRLKT